MPEYVSRKIVREILGTDADQFNVMLVPDTPGTFPRSNMMQVVLDKARLLRAYLSEDEGVTYP